MPDTTQKKRYSVCVTKKSTVVGVRDADVCVYLCSGIGELTVCFNELANMYVGLEYDVFAHLGTPVFYPAHRARWWKGAIDMTGHAE